MNINSFKGNYSNFWGHNDADMLEIGNGLNPAESRSHFAFWAAMKSPLLIGTNVQTLSNDEIGILRNQWLLFFNQDDMFGAPAMPYKWGTNQDWTFNASWPAEYWAGECQIGILLLMFNPGEENGRQMSTTADEVPGLDGSKTYRGIDVWTGRDFGCSSQWNRSVDSHDTAVLLLTSQCKDGVN
jgi:alpha-galactosidase